MAETLEFLIDRSLGRKHLAAALAALGYTVHTLASVYGESEAQELDDEEWLREAGTRDWIVLMKDAAIRRRPSEREALSRAGVRAFCLMNAQLRGAEQTARFVDNMARIVRQANTPGPYIYGVYTDHLKRVWPE